MKPILLASLVLAVTSGTTFAATPWIDARQNVQSHRIYNGVASIHGVAAKVVPDVTARTSEARRIDFMIVLR